jgi:23S rRNA (adenine2503-C2)-methyltransferase
MPEDASKIERMHFFALSPTELDDKLLALGLPRFRGKQLRDWVYGKLVTDLTKMSNLSARDRELIEAHFEFEPGKVVRRQVSDDGTFKLLIEWHRVGWPEPATTETVLIPDADRRTACVSSQVGCPVGCKFCASGLAGLKGSLDAGEIAFQIYALNRELAPDNERVTNVVFMGMGEPMSNYANVMAAVRVMHDPQCMNMGARRLTISTVGVPKRIRDLAHESLPINLALSLHAPNEPLRKQLIPWADHFELDDILDACRYYFEQSGREITLEYILLQGVNDRPEHARELARLCATMRANVNLIRYNEVEGLPFLRPRGDDVMTFQSILRIAGVNAHVRKSRGRDIDAACGQLRRRAQQEAEALVQLGTPGKGFTLTELLVALVVVLLLLATFVPYVLNAREMNRRTRCTDNLRAILVAMDAYVAKNEQRYPTSRFDPARLQWTAFTGLNNGAVEANDVTASLWLLVSEGFIADPSVFVCPSAGGSASAVKGSNFSGTDSLGYGYAVPFPAEGAGYRLDKDRLGFRSALVADRGPAASTWKSNAGTPSSAGPLDQARLNSPNHGGAGQNVMYPQHVEWVVTSYAGAGFDPRLPKPGDNIYSALSALPLVENVPPDLPGFVGRGIMPSYPYDTYLVPASGE